MMLFITHAPFGLQKSLIRLCTRIYYMPKLIYIVARGNILLVMSIVKSCFPVNWSRIHTDKSHQPKFFDIFREYIHILAINLFIHFRVMSVNIKLAVTSKLRPHRVKKRKTSHCNCDY